MNFTLDQINERKIRVSNIDGLAYGYVAPKSQSIYTEGLDSNGLKNINHEFHVGSYAILIDRSETYSAIGKIDGTYRGNDRQTVRFKVTNLATLKSSDWYIRSTLVIPGSQIDFDPNNSSFKTKDEMVLDWFLNNIKDNQI